MLKIFEIPEVTNGIKVYYGPIRNWKNNYYMILTGKEEPPFEKFKKHKVPVKFLRKSYVVTSNKSNSIYNIYIFKSNKKYSTIIEKEIIPELSRDDLILQGQEYGKICEILLNSLR